ncbi:hypothetical protein [Acetilactobacillus jinshanensis]|uniref:Uncharacterized protein n=1 Tax=Acetilactobacillus jinshanensis TaxID=1720083 RepID=A0A4P6ZL39_9LACO|nr:hypothetical protein [Acetilactobacillus jinshanensis]QBP18247.1 hypothetical protein ELX58_03655 [Acetilactobacillus jinshanensis]
MLHDIKHLKLITYYAKVKSCVRRGNPLTFSIMFGLMLFAFGLAVLYIICAIINGIVGSYAKAVIQIIYSVFLLILVFGVLFGPFFYNVYNSATYIIGNIKYNHNSIKVNGVNYYIISELRNTGHNNEYLVQTKEQIKASRKFPVIYSIYSVRKHQIISGITCSCAEDIPSNTKKYCRHFGWRILAVIGSVMVLFILFFVSFHNLISVPNVIRFLRWATRI